MFSMLILSRSGCCPYLRSRIFFVDLSKIDHARIDAHWGNPEVRRREPAGFFQGRLLANPQIFR
jgi:hypothetical protein